MSLLDVENTTQSSSSSILVRRITGGNGRGGALVQLAVMVHVSKVDAHATLVAAIGDVQRPGGRIVAFPDFGHALDALQQGGKTADQSRVRHAGEEAVVAFPDVGARPRCTVAELQTCALISHALGFMPIKF